MIGGVAQNWLDAKEAEKVATEKRRELEDQMLEILKINETLEGTDTTKADGYTIRVTGRMNRKVDADRIQEIAAEEGLTAHLSNLFRWKPEVNMSAWKNADKSITEPLLGGITTTPGRASFSINQE